MSVAGLILSGGESRRFGADKALALVRGKPLVARVAEALAAVPVDLVVIASRDSVRAAAHVTAAEAAATGIPIRAATGESAEAEGPLAGMLAGMRATSATWVALAPCDAPFLSAALYRALLQRAKGVGTGAAVEVDGGPHPLLSVVHRATLLDAGERAWRAGERSARRVLERAGVALLSEAEARAADPELASLVVVHAPEDLARWG